MSYRRFKLAEIGGTSATAATEPTQSVATVASVADREIHSDAVSHRSVATVAMSQAGAPGSETDAADRETAFQERAALIEDGASVPRAWAEGLASLDLAAPPAGFTPALWQQVVEDGARFLDRWGSEAAELGWSALDVFGVHPVVPTSRFDAMGLVPLIRGGEVVAIAAERATICTPHGGQLTYLRRPRPGAVAFWDLAYQGRLAREARG